jgi:FkbM family methyltransferase
MAVLARKITGAAALIGRKLAQLRGRAAAERAESWASAFHRAINNVDFDMVRNGELRALKLMGRFNPECILDVGANVGEWSLIASELFPAATIHSFEVVPSTYTELVKKTGHQPNILPNQFGLSDEAGEITIYLGSKGSTDATAFKIEGMNLHEKLYVNRIQGQTRTGTDYLLEKQIGSVDFLKIDTEGMDLRVIKGFGGSLDRVRVIQFEYGIFNIASRDLLVDFCRYLGSMGFRVGKVFPQSVNFFDYNFQLENFYYSNYIAVRKDETAIIRAMETGSP